VLTNPAKQNKQSVTEQTLALKVSLGTPGTLVLKKSRFKFHKNGFFQNRFATNQQKVHPIFVLVYNKETGYFLY
jgi:hypothetical protein